VQGRSSADGRRAAPQIIVGDVVPPMELTFSAPPATRLRQLLVLLLLALALLAGVSVSQSRDVESRIFHTEVVALPPVLQLHELANRVDEQRGMAALHLTLRSAAERTALEGRLQASRQQVERRMAAHARRLQSDAERQHHAAVQASLAAFWAAQDELIALSGRAAQDPVVGQQARALLAGPAKQAFDRLRADIEAWWAETERSAVQAMAEARAEAHLATVVVWAQAMLVALALAVAWVLLRLPLRPLQPPPPPADVLDTGAARQHLQALIDAVATARRGEPGRAAGLSASEARHLAEQVDSAARGLRRLIDRPAAPVPSHRQPADPGI
jgi:hypothetical protein